MPNLFDVPSLPHIMSIPAPFNVTKTEAFACLVPSPFYDLYINEAYRRINYKFKSPPLFSIDTHTVKVSFPFPSRI